MMLDSLGGAVELMADMVGIEVYKRSENVECPYSLCWMYIP